MEERINEELVVDLMQMKDLDDVIKVESRCFKTSWSRYSFVHELKYSKFSYYLVVRHRGKVIGYGGMWIIIDEAHVTNIGVLPEYRGQGIGELLMRSLIAGAKARGAKRMTLEVRKSNYIAQNLYSKLGFEPAGIRRGYYIDDSEDAVIMWMDEL